MFLTWLKQNAADPGNGSDLKKEKDKAPSSPYDNLSAKKELENSSSVQNGMVVLQNGALDDDKVFKYVSARYLQFEVHAQHVCVN